MGSTSKDDLANDEDSNVDIAPAVKELEAAMGSQDPAKGSAKKANATPILSLDQTATQRLQTAQITGQNIFLVAVTLQEDTPWASVRCFQVLQGLSLMGDVITSKPTQEDIEAEKVSGEIQVVIATEHDADTLRAPLVTLEDISEVSIEPYTPPEESASSGKDPNGEAIVRKPGQSQTVRIDVERLDHLMNTIGELVIDRTRILQIGQMLSTRYKEDELVQALGTTTAHVVKVVDELQEDIMKARMLPIGTVFSGFPRMVRDLAQKINKKVDFEIGGQETEIDRTVIEHIRDPLVHLLRNSVDHGIETPEERVAQGKPGAGTLKLSAIQENSYIIITVEDDGKGIDAKRVKESSVRKGIISAEVASRMTDAEALDLIFSPGASTAEQTTDISGRGVGMDIVKTHIESINGFVKLDTKVGEGTKFTLMLPLTLATLQALLFSVDKTVYAVPLVYVLEAVIIDSGEISTIEGNEVIRLRDNVVPLLRLKTVFNSNHQGFNPDDKTYIVVVRFGDRLVGLCVDSLIELQDVTVKSIGTYMGDVKGIAGVSILGDGQVVLILDIPTLISTSIAKTGPKLDRALRN
ncbi:MAG: chemotaxis protein CheA [Chloroflexi bacterium]|nr:chemotaxis protein CheA [Chloroflexota bacterium]MDA1219541.1 chemotaxis protein CheA [Chloroflexota bacterium]